MTDFSTSSSWGFTMISAADMARFFYIQDRLIPRQFDGWQRTVELTSTKYGGAGPDPKPKSRLEEDPRLVAIFEGYPFSIDFNRRRGHAYMLSDQLVTGLTGVSTGVRLAPQADLKPLDTYTPVTPPPVLIRHDGLVALQHAHWASGS